jgi:hypothetical protein
MVEMDEMDEILMPKQIGKERWMFLPVRFSLDEIQKSEKSYEESWDEAIKVSK